MRFGGGGGGINEEEEDESCVVRAEDGIAGEEDAIEADVLAKVLSYQVAKRWGSVKGR